MSNVKCQMSNLGISIIIIILALQGAVFAKTAADISFVGVTARSLAMGNASTAVAENAEAIFVNPASLAETKQWSFTSLSTTLMQTVNYQMVGGSYATDFGVVGLGYIGAESPAGYYTTDQNSVASAPEMSYADRLFMASYATNLANVLKTPAGMGDLYVGVNLKYYSKGLSKGYTNSGSGYSTDLGLLLKANEKTRVGITLQNAGSSISWDTGTAENLESSVKLGIAQEVTLPFTSEKVLLSSDLKMGPKTTLHVGMEYNPFSILSLRAGLDQSAASSSSATTTVVNNLTAGVGLNVAGVSFDYAYHQDSTLSQNNTHFFSFSYAPAVLNEKSVQEAKITHDQKLANLPEVKNAKELDKKAGGNGGIVIDADLAKLMKLAK